MNYFFRWLWNLKADTRTLKKKANKLLGAVKIQSELIKSSGEAFTQACDNFVNVIWKAENQHLDRLPSWFLLIKKQIQLFGEITVSSHHWQDPMETLLCIMRGQYFRTGNFLPEEQLRHGQRREMVEQMLGFCMLENDRKAIPIQL